jgi:hypothetical protein
VRRRGVHIAEDNRQAVFAAADDHNFRIRGLRKLQRRLDATPTQVGLRDPLADRLLKIAYAFCLDLLAFRLSFFALDAKLVFLRNEYCSVLRLMAATMAAGSSMPVTSMS